MAVKYLENEGIDIAMGLVQRTSHIHKFGANFDVSSNTDPETIWSAGGLYPWSSLATAQTLYVQSDSEDDTETVEIQGLDSEYNLLSEEISISGTTSVTTVNQFSRVYRVIYDHGNVNVGTITLRVNSGIGTVVAQIEPDYAQTLMSVYTVPAGHTAYMVCWNTSVEKGKNAQVRLYQAPYQKSFKIAHMAELFQNMYRYDFPIPLKFEEKTDIEVRAAAVEYNNTRVCANFDIVLVRNHA